MLFFLAGYVILSRFYVAQIGYFSVAQHDGFFVSNLAWSIFTIQKSALHLSTNKLSFIG